MKNDNNIKNIPVYENPDNLFDALMGNVSDFLSYIDEVIEKLNQTRETIKNITKE